MSRTGTQCRLRATCRVESERAASLRCACLPRNPQRLEWLLTLRATPPILSSADFLGGAYEAGLAGPGFFYFGSDSVTQPALWQTNERLNSNETLRLAILVGYFGLTESPGIDSNPIDPHMTHAAYLERRRRFLPAVEAGGQCSLATDDDERSPTRIWADDHDNNASTPLACAPYNQSGASAYEAYAYDAVFAVARALHSLIEVRNRTSIVGSELRDELLERTRFWGVTGDVTFFNVRPTISSNRVCLGPILYPFPEPHPGSRLRNPLPVCDTCVSPRLRHLCVPTWCVAGLA